MLAIKLLSAYQRRESFNVKNGGLNVDEEIRFLKLKVICRKDFMKNSFEIWFF